MVAELYIEDDYPYDDEEDDDCLTCGGEGITEYLDDEGSWGEDCPSEENHFRYRRRERRMMGLDDVMTTAPLTVLSEVVFRKEFPLNAAR